MVLACSSDLTTDTRAIPDICTSVGVADRGLFSPLYLLPTYSGPATERSRCAVRPVAQHRWQLASHPTETTIISKKTHNIHLFVLLAATDFLDEEK